MLFLIMILGTGCASVTNDYCLVAEPIIPSDKDIDVISSELAKKIEIHDSTYEKLCKQQK